LVDWLVDWKMAMTTNKTKAIQTAAAALKRVGLPREKIEAALSSLGLAIVEPCAGNEACRIATMARAKAAEPGVYRVADARRLYLKKVSYDSGAWFLRYSFGGKRHEMGLGSIADVDIEAARAASGEMYAKVRRGTDPLGEKRAYDAARRAEARKAATPTVEQAVAAFLKDHAPTWKGAYARTTWFNPIKNYAFPVIGQLKVDAVEVRHIVAILRATDEKGVSVLGRKIRAHLKTVFDSTIAHGQRNAALGNPADPGVIKAAYPRNKNATEHFRRIKLDDAPATFRKLEGLAAGNGMLAGWMFMILTASRPGEAMAARWAEIDLAKRTWTIPKERTKTKKDHVAPLSSLALTVLELQAKVREGDLIFASRGGGRCAHSTFATAPANAGIDAGAPHSWRSIFRDACGDRLRVERDLAEAALAHSLGAVEGAYRRETAIEARRPVMEAYARWLLSEDVNVIAFPAKA
jgi:integrase